jgi:hypothetical protein
MTGIGCRHGGFLPARRNLDDRQSPLAEAEHLAIRHSLLATS